MNAADILTEIESGLQAGELILPLIFGALGVQFPQIAAYGNAYLPLLQVAEGAVQVVEKATGMAQPAATAAVVDHLTQGKPNAPALS